MDFRDYQLAAADFAFHPGAGDHSWQSVAYAALGANEEAGEVAGKVKKVHREDGQDFSMRKEAILTEVGDTLWYLSQVCTELKVDLGEVALGNLSKLALRRERGTLPGDGDNR